MLHYTHGGFKPGDAVVSTKAVAPSAVRYIKYFITYAEAVRVYFDTERDPPAVIQSGFEINDWVYESGLLRLINANRAQSGNTTWKHYLFTESIQHPPRLPST